jgi:hypothetical protein
LTIFIRFSGTVSKTVSLFHLKARQKSFALFLSGQGKRRLDPGLVLPKSRGQVWLTLLNFPGSAFSRI